MKRHWFAALCLSILLLSACAKDMTPLEKLEKAGFQRTLSGDTASACARAQQAFNREIQDYGGSFAVTVLRFVNLRKGNAEAYTTCQIVEFATDQQAQQYYHLAVDISDRSFFLSLQDSVVILTDSQEAMGILGGVFA